jgi:hypothetical protein
MRVHPAAEFQRLTLDGTRHQQSAIAKNRSFRKGGETSNLLKTDHRHSRPMAVVTLSVAVSRAP